MSQFLKLMHTSALNFSQANQLRLKILAGFYNMKNCEAYHSDFVHLKKRKSSFKSFKRHYPKSDTFSSEREANERTMKELDRENYKLLYQENNDENHHEKTMGLNKETLKELSEDNEDYTDMEENHHVKIMGLNKETIKELSKDNEDYTDMKENHHEKMMGLNKETIKELSKDNEDYTDMKENHHVKMMGLNKETLKELSKDNEDYTDMEEVEELGFQEDNQKHQSFITRDDVKKAMLDIYGKVNENILDKIMSVNQVKREEISLHQLDTQIDKILVEDEIFQKDFPKRVFYEYDTNLDGKLNKKDIYTVLKNIGENVDKGRLKSFMKSYDKDEDGYLNYEEFCEFSKNELFPR